MLAKISEKLDTSDSRSRGMKRGRRDSRVKRPRSNDRSTTYDRSSSYDRSQSRERSNSRDRGRDRVRNRIGVVDPKVEIKTLEKGGTIQELDMVQVCFVNTVK